jgi:hypothetical protein
MLSNELKPAIKTKCQSLLSKGILLLHETAHPHTAIHTVWTLQKLGFEVLELPAHSPGLAPSDYHLFHALKGTLGGHRFATDQHVQEDVHSLLRNMSKTFFSEGMNKLMACWNVCIEKQGHYIEKLCN